MQKKHPLGITVACIHTYIQTNMCTDMLVCMIGCYRKTQRFEEFSSINCSGKAAVTHCVKASVSPLYRFVPSGTAGFYSGLTNRVKSTSWYILDRSAVKKDTHTHTSHCLTHTYNLEFLIDLNVFSDWENLDYLEKA